MPLGVQKTSQEMEQKRGQRVKEYPTDFSNCDEPLFVIVAQGTDYAIFYLYPTALPPPQISMSMSLVKRN